ncbi:hypothetical protein GCM10010493_78700 [Streptomyces lavendulae subsp. grasserius]
MNWLRSPRPGTALAPVPVHHVAPPLARTAHGAEPGSRAPYAPRTALTERSER